MSAWQILESREADFDEMTWTFCIGSGNEVGAGSYAVLPADEFRKSMDRLEHAERILRDLCDTENAETIGPKNIEAIHRFFDPPV